MSLTKEIKNEYILLTPGPLTTTATVKETMLKDWCTWDNDYNSLVQKLRQDIVSLAVYDEKKRCEYTSVLMQGSGTFAVESVIGSVVPENGRLLVLANGAYGNRIFQIAKTLKIDAVCVSLDETKRIDGAVAEQALNENQDVTHVAFVHCETTTGILNDIESCSRIVKERGKVLIVDAMSSFGGIPFDMASLDIDFMITSANKCIQGVPGFGIIAANRKALEACKGFARSVSLDLYDQCETMEKHGGKWRFTSPTHVVRAFVQAMAELHEEGGIKARHERYAANQRQLVQGMEELGFKALLPKEFQSPIITSFLYPDDANFSFNYFYEYIKKRGYVLYPGKISSADTFRIGNIGDVDEHDIAGLLAALKEYVTSVK